MMWFGDLGSNHCPVELAQPMWACYSSLALHLWLSQGLPEMRGRRKRMWSSSKLLRLKIFQASLAELLVGDGRQPPPLPWCQGTKLTATHSSTGEQKRKGIAMYVMPIMQTGSCTLSEGPSWPSLAGSTEWPMEADSS